MHETKGVEELRGFEVVEGDPDVVGWEVVDRDGRRVGVVAELLADSEHPSARYLEVRLDRPAAGGPTEAQPTGTAVDVRQDAIPELDSLSGQGGVIGQAAVPGDAPHEMPARTIGEALVRDSLLDIENQMTSGELPGLDRGQGRTLIPAGEVRFENAMRRIRLEPNP
jgi:hypothetical protein